MSWNDEGTMLLFEVKLDDMASWVAAEDQREALFLVLDHEGLVDSVEWCSRIDVRLVTEDEARKIPFMGGESTVWNEFNVQTKPEVFASEEWVP